MEDELPLIEMNRDSDKRYLERESRFLNETEYSRKKRLKSASAGGRRRKDGCSCDSCDSCAKKRLHSLQKVAMVAIVALRSV